MDEKSLEKHHELVDPPRTLFDRADELGVPIPTSCGRVGQCHECVVEVFKGADSLGDRTDAERFLSGEFRLACQATLRGTKEKVDFAPLWRRPQILGSTATSAPLDLDPAVSTDGESVFRDSVQIGRFRGALLGLAVDLGTTTVAMELVDLGIGEVVAAHTFENPQRFGGSDVMHRISYDAAPAAQGELQKAAVAAINRGLRVMCEGLGCRPADVYEIVVAGNTTMRDLLFGLDVQPIGQRPYKSLTEIDMREGKASTTALMFGARDIGIRANREAQLIGLPVIASHVGGDTMAGLVAIGMVGSDPSGMDLSETVMFIDMGTNTEVVLRHRGVVYTASCPAGPAFEGGQVSFGMRAQEGAIESIRLNADGEAEEFQTIGGGPPRGLCGSGLIDLLAELRRSGLMSEMGVFRNEPKLSALTVVPEWGLSLSRQDVSLLAQAKAANYAGQLIVLQTAGIGPASVDKLYLAGAFANYVNVENAVSIGLLAPVPEGRIRKVGNAALGGARKALLARRVCAVLDDFAKEVQHIELETTADFFEVFVEGCQFKPMIDQSPEVLSPHEIIDPHIEVQV
jgi:uncharacterized 2Fe-2S/4Fe-4S cluster protein (DUF4445 family)